MNRINSCFHNFQRSLQVLVPLFESAGIGWREEEQYDGFDDIAQGLFSGFVLKEVEMEISAASPIVIKYDFGEFTGNSTCYFRAKSVASNVEGRFCKYVTVDQPFDSVEICIVDSRKREVISARQVDFEFICTPADR